MNAPPRHLTARDHRGTAVELSPQAERGPGRLSPAAIVVLAIVAACILGAVLVGPEIVWFVSPWAALVLLAEFRYLGPKRIAQESIDSALSAHRCPGCLYSLDGLPLMPDGCVSCPECGAAWRLPQGPGAIVP